MEQKTGHVTIVIYLETDDTLKGPCGKAEVILRDTNGAALATLMMDKDLCRGGKKPGRAVDVAKTYQVTKVVPFDVARKTTTLLVVAHKTTSNHIGLWGFNPDDIVNAIRIIFGG